MSATREATPRALAIGGLDPSAGAGVLLDAFVMARLGYQPAVAVTTVTAQNSASFAGMWPMGPEVLHAQLDALLAEGDFACVKVGALGSDAIAEVLRGWLANVGPPVVVLDPVLASSSGGSLVAGANHAVDAIARVSNAITPNAEEAGRLAGHPGIASEDAAVVAAKVLADRYGSAVCVTGLSSGGPDEAVDMVARCDGGIERYPHALVPGVGDVRGTGCMFSSALACHLGAGMGLSDSVSAAHATVRELLSDARPIGRGRWQVDLSQLATRR